MTSIWRGVEYIYTLRSVPCNSVQSCAVPFAWGACVCKQKLIYCKLESRKSHCSAPWEIKCTWLNLTFPHQMSSRWSALVRALFLALAAAAAASSQAAGASAREFCENPTSNDKNVDSSTVGCGFPSLLFAQCPAEATLPGSHNDARLNFCWKFQAASVQFLIATNV